jgi:hypothetical protein
VIDLDDLDFDADDYGGDDELASRETKCRDCQVTDVYWAKDRHDHWVLYDFKTSRKHQCNAEHVTANRLDAFENTE